MSVRQQYRVLLKRRLETDPNSNWLDFCRFALDVKDEKEARRLWEALPLTVCFSVTNESNKELLEQRLERAGIDASFTIVSTRDKHCRRHRHIIADQICPRCFKRPICSLCAEFEFIQGCTNCVRWSHLRISFRRFRIAILLGILILIAGGTYLKNRHIADWNSTLKVGIFPIHADDTGVVDNYLQGLTSRQFYEVPLFFQDEANRYGIHYEPLIQIILGPSIEDTPPNRPGARANWFDIVLWSLKLRYWAFRIQRQNKLPDTDIRLFILFHKPQVNRSLDHSLGLKEGHIGLLYLFADPILNEFNQVLVTHELLHTIGATDKYGQDELPIYPDGLADPDKVPLFPQTKAEIMAGSIMLSKNTKRFPKSLNECNIGPKTAREIGWLSASDSP